MDCIVCIPVNPREIRDVRHYSASRPEVAVKKYLNYLRRYTQERPTEVIVKAEILPSGSHIYHVWKAQVEWYHGKLQDAILKSDYESMWWKLVKLTRE